MVNKNKNLIEERYDFSEDCSVPMKRLIGNQLTLPQFATLFVRRECFDKFDTNGKFLELSCNDMLIRIVCAVQGDVHYINRNMSCYRRFTEGSWTERVGKKNDQFTASLKKYIPFLKALDDYTNGKYKNDILKCIDRREFEIDLLENRYKDAIKRRAFKKASIKRKSYILLGCLFPEMVNKIKQ